MDWQKLIKRIERKGITRIQLSTALSVSRSYVQQLATGFKANPSWEVGNKLIILSKGEK